MATPDEITAAIDALRSQLTVLEQAVTANPPNRPAIDRASTAAEQAWATLFVLLP